MTHRLAVTLMGIACFMTIAQPAVMASQPVETSDSEAAVRNVALHNRQLTGQVTNAQGVATADAHVIITQGTGNVVGRTMTDADGNFVVSNLRGGLYQLVVAGPLEETDQIVAYAAPTNIQAWAAGTAPPVATNSVLITHDDIVRGQGIGGGGLLTLTSLGLSATAMVLSIVLPLTIDNSDAS